MNQNRSPIVSLISLISLIINLGLTSQQLFADKAPVKLQAPLKPGQEREDYQECLTAVIKKYKLPDDAKRAQRLRYGIATCRERYPALSIMTECKREMTRAYRDNHADLKLALQQCREEYLKFTFNPKSSLPFAMRDEQAFFAGAGLNHSLAVKEKDTYKTPNILYMGDGFGNYSCQPLLGAMFQNQPPEYLLFGNDPFNYTPLRHAKREVVLQAIGMNIQKTPATMQHRELGELNYDPKSKELTNYFPTSYCFFNRKLGALYEGVKIYYLLDRAATQVTPYFGVAFYSKEAKLSALTLAEEISKALGQTYKVTGPKPGVYLVAQTEMSSFDAEGDPKNICQSSSISAYIALVRSQETSTLAAYALLANTANLCRFGDRVASRLLKKGLQTPPK